MFVPILTVRTSWPSVRHITLELAQGAVAGAFLTAVLVVAGRIGGAL